MDNTIDLSTPEVTGMKKEALAALERSIAGAYDVNMELEKAYTEERAYASSYDIQKRGYHYPGDTNSFSPYGFLGSDYFFGNTRTKDVADPMMGAFGLGGLDSIGLYNAGAYGGNGSMTNMGSHITRAAKMKMALCVQAYKGFGVAKNVIDLMANFAAEGLKVYHPRPAIQKFYQSWMEHVDLRGRVKDILRYYYKYGNVFIYTTYGIIDAATYLAMKTAKAALSVTLADNNDPAQPERQKKIDEEKAKTEKSRQIPWRYTLLNPFQMDAIGDKFFGTTRWVFVMDERTYNTTQLPKYETEDYLDDTEVNLPPEFKDLTANKETSAADARIVELRQENLWTMHYMKDDHEEWADPMLWPVMADIFYKNKLRQSDISVCNSIIKAITIFKLGDYKNGFIPGAEYMRKFAELLRTPTEAMTLVWNDAITIDHSYPPTEKLLSMAKYEAVDKDILRGLGVPDILLGGSEGGNFSNGFLGVRTLLERLEEGRGEVEKWINKQLKMIAEIMGHRDVPKVKFGRMSLRDENAEKQLILGLLDRNIISIEAVLEVFGEDYELELARLREEEKIRDDEGLLVKHGPFVDPLAEMTDEAQMEHEDEQMERQQQLDMQVMDKQMKQQVQFKKMDISVKKQDLAAKRKMLKQGSKNGKKGVNGRPAGSKGVKQQKKRVTKPKGMAYLVEYETIKKAAGEVYASTFSCITNCVLEDTGKKYWKSLSSEQRQGIEELTFAVASYLPIDEEVTLDRVREVMAATTPLVTNPSIHEAAEILTKAFVLTNSRSPSMEESRNIRFQAMASHYLDDEDEEEEEDDAEE
jgi:hypothetical protein